MRKVCRQHRHADIWRLAWQTMGLAGKLRGADIRRPLRDFYTAPAIVTNFPATLESLIAEHVDLTGIPLPAQGRTLARWQLFAAIAHAQGAVAIKLFEAHADALAILAELTNATPRSGTRWAVWAAQPPDARVCATPARAEDFIELATQAGVERGETVRLNGRKAWCSGACEVTHAVLTCHDDHGHALLAVIDLHGPGVTVTTDGWHAVGMAGTRSGDVMLRDCPALLLGKHDAYVQRTGFWHGGAGIAACWYGAVLPMAQAVRDTVRKFDNAHAAANLGAIDGDLHGAAALLRDTAAWIDANPRADALVPAMRVRTAVEAVTRRVLERAGNVLGAGPLCRNPRLAALYADLPVFLRQSHAERDLATLGHALSASDTAHAL